MKKAHVRHTEGWAVKGILALILSLGLLAGCGGEFAPGDRINVVCREDGSGTRGAFVELTGILEKGDGIRVDHTSKNALVAGKTGIMLATVAGDRNAIGYLSTGSVNDTVKFLAVDGVAPTAENVKNGGYALARPFNIAVPQALSAVAVDFVSFIMSGEGQAIVAQDYVPADDDAAAFVSDLPVGRLVIAGSSSVAPVMEKLVEGYGALNPGAVIELQVTDSTAGINAVLEGIADIAMASRDLKESELESLTPKAIAIDGLAVIVHPENPLDNIASADLRAVFTGKTITWEPLLPAALPE